jgi:dGTPase
MLKNLKDLLKDENSKLSPYAMHNADSRGRLHKERPDNTRTPFQRDRDRIMHCKAFRRLQAKTQVFVSYFGDHYRDRLTHTIEVAQIARDVARTLGLNEDLAEAVALAHDLGHPPFGHAGEHVLDEEMSKFGHHFEHNEQSRRIVEKLESMSPDFEGLNLTIEVMDGLLKHEQAHHLAHLQYKTSAHLESQAADLADEIAYTNHDIDDGLRSGLITMDDMRKFTLWRRAEKDIRELYGEKIDLKSLQSRVISRMISLMIRDLCKTSEQNIKKFRLKSVEDVRSHKGKIIGFSARLKPEIRELREFLMKNFYFNPKVAKQINHGRKLLKKLFLYYIKNPQQLPEPYRTSIKLGEAREIVVKDYIAGMTDHYAEEQAKLIS